ncbi:PTS sugar transporter subunit IIB [Halanaerobium salsuginis]|jgi:PTS system cellobiose-specific IIB component|uniref:PTS system, cellobiose-specific IIB component n=1 Tax=Halanaerobium salsuginis TaxID=29563 RepID=A0A1I4I3C8_9FIRM|nr:PTS sugar transporter subunit IIB [Halanaerobium salsuginis]SFL48938.1 PTS system, cellobiose-specific IIB component [Halanaerobium salsuginis]
MNILLVCNAGMSTSLVVQKMEKEAAKRGLEVKIKAEPVEKFEDIIAEYDVALLGPQIRYKLKPFKKIGAENNVPVEVIETAAYGMADGKKVLDHALSLIK